MKIIVDTREQKPLWKKNITRQKLDEGDYTTETLLNKQHVERKSASDLYGSIIKGHKRFRNELLRAKKKGLQLYLFVECTKETFISKQWDGAYRTKVGPRVLAKIINTIEERYELPITWCNNRNDMKKKIRLLFKEKES